MKKNYNLIKLLKYCCVLLFLLYFLAIFIGKMQIKSVNYDEYISVSKYFTMSSDSVYRTFSRLKNVLINDDNVKKVDDLFDGSDYVLRVSVYDIPFFYGNGMINNLKVEDKLKGNDDILIGDKIKVYDLISSWNYFSINYYGGTTPLSSKYEYIIFIKEAPNPNVDDTYIFSSIRYGHFIIDDDVNILNDYNEGSLSMEEIMLYDYVCSEQEEDCKSISLSYQQMKKELLKGYLNKKK